MLLSCTSSHLCPCPGFPKKKLELWKWSILHQCSWFVCYVRLPCPYWFLALAIGCSSVQFSMILASINKVWKKSIRLTMLLVVVFLVCWCQNLLLIAMDWIFICSINSIKCRYSQHIFVWLKSQVHSLLSYLPFAIFVCCGGG